MNPRLVISALLFGAVALACGSRSHSESSVAVAVASPEKVVRHAEHATLAPGALRSAFNVSAEQHKLRFALHVTNATKKSVELAFPSGQEYDFAVVDSTGKEVYRWASGRMFTQSLQNKVIDGGETMRFEERAEKPLPSGTYVAVATLRSSNFPVQERVEFALP
jgi:hypothetical protein